MEPHSVEGLEMTERKQEEQPQSESTALPTHNETALNLDAAQEESSMARFLVVISYFFTFLLFPITFLFCIKIVNQYERAVIFRLGRLREGGAKGPGLFFIVPCIDTYVKVDLRVVSFSVPPQEILSKDSVTVNVDAVVYFRICNTIASIVNIENAKGSTRLLAQTTLRNVLGTKTLAEMLSHREEISTEMQRSLDEATENWGVKVERVEVKDIRLPQSMQRAMAAEAEANREAKAKVIAADGERLASESLRTAATVLSETPTAIQLRYLQTLNTISAEHNSTIIFPLPMELLSGFINRPQPQPLNQSPPTFIQNPPNYEAVNA
ncbi:unnamed protein product [Bursaphelenchus xylophilus]|uniref:(pine wood nematode) hypothetical protein n=1 Tax=Bursaphelenchus xylophilus TaxID=6326 RepID=A0A1I7SWY7_BURXY|nr:unnamed protein product [Bursaphelenchus xylophilus]CAG9100052.1 unnamed protein product [Bursaphelenchus xylophilus]